MNKEKKAKKQPEKSTNNREDVILFEHTLSEGLNNGIKWQTSFRLKQAIYRFKNGNKQMENKYNRCDIHMIKDGDPNTFSLSLIGFHWLIETIYKELEERVKLRDAGKNPELLEFSRVFYDDGSDRYVSYLVLNHRIAQIASNDNYRSFGLSLCTSDRNELLDLETKISYLLKWDHKWYTNPMQLINLGEAFYVHCISEKIKELIRGDCEACQSDAEPIHECKILFKNREDKAELLDKAKEGIYDTYRSGITAIMDALNISESARANLLEDHMPTYDLKNEEIIRRCISVIDCMDDKQFNFKELLSIIPVED